MKYLINTILFAGLCLSVDVLSIKLPVNAKSLSYTGYGIATKNNYSLNPATLSNSEKSYFEFSNNKWLFDVDGAYISYNDKNLKLSGYYWQIDNIELYDEEPSSSPLGTFGSKTFFINFSQGFKLKKAELGYSLGYTYMKLLEYTDKGVTLDLGYRQDINESTSMGLLIKNLNTGFKDDSQIPQVITIGSSQKIKNIPIILNLDLFYDEDKGSGSYQGVTFKKNRFDFTAGYRYYHEDEELDIGLGFNLMWNNLEFSISTLLLENSSFKSPISYQVSYLF